MQKDYQIEIVSGADAFGDGEHPSTRLALAALHGLAAFDGVRNALDVGCGSGILALKMASQWRVPVLATDIMAEAVAATKQNARHNQLEGCVTALCADGLSHDTIQENAPYDVMTANLLAELLIEMELPLTEALAEEGILILSGILTAHADDVIHTYQNLNMNLLQKLSAREWTALILRKP